MKKFVLGLTVLISANAQAGIFCGALTSDPDGFAITSPGSVTIHVGRGTFMNSSSQTRDAFLAASKSKSTLCISASFKPLDAENVIASEILKARPVDLR